MGQNEGRIAGKDGRKRRINGNKFSTISYPIKVSSHKLHLVLKAVYDRIYGRQIDGKREGMRERVRQSEGGDRIVTKTE